MVHEHDQKLIEGLKAICRLAQINWPRDTDLRVSTGSGASATGVITIPSRLLEQIIRDAEQTDMGLIQKVMNRTKD